MGLWVRLGLWSTDAAPAWAWEAGIVQVGGWGVPGSTTSCLRSAAPATAYTTCQILPTVHRTYFLYTLFLPTTCLPGLLTLYLNAFSWVLWFVSFCLDLYGIAWMGALCLIWTPVH